MKNDVTPVAAVEEKPVHFLKKSHMFVSTKHVNFDDLTAFEAGAMSLALVLAVVIGVLATSANGILS